MGEFSSIAVDLNGRVHISYYERGGGNLRYAMEMSEPTEPLYLMTEESVGGVTLNWGAPLYDYGFQVTGYYIYRGTSSGQGDLLAIVGNVTEFTDNTVGEDTYYYWVSAVNAVGAGKMSAEASVTVVSISTVPDAPRNLNAEAGNGTVLLTWDPPEDDGGTPIIGYKLYRGTSEGAVVFWLSVGNATSLLDDNVENDQTYYYRVSAVNAVGEGPLTDTESATPSVDAGDDGEGNDLLLYIVIIIVALAAVAGIAVLLLKRKK